jgi:hypothetical protein
LASSIVAFPSSIQSIPEPKIVVDRVDPLEFSSEAAAILREAWSAPCLDYRDDILRWRFDAPSSQATPVGFAAFAGNRAIAFTGAMGARFRIGGSATDGYLLSFCSTRPDSRSSTAVVPLLRAEARMCKSAQLPCLVFAKPGSAGEAILSVLDAVGLKRHNLGQYVTHMGMSQACSAGYSVEPTTPERWAELYNSLPPSADNLMTADVTPKWAAHQTADPCGRRLLVCYGPDGSTTGVAVAADTHSIGVSGRQITPALHYIRCHDAESLRAMMHTAAGNREKVIVSAPNVRYLPESVTREAGFRATKSVFAGYLFAPEKSAVSVTDCEVV